jgi:hypothetical protein
LVISGSTWRSDHHRSDAWKGSEPSPYGRDDRHVAQPTQRLQISLDHRSVTLSASSAGSLKQSRQAEVSGLANRHIVRVLEGRIATILSHDRESGLSKCQGRSSRVIALGQHLKTLELICINGIASAAVLALATESALHGRPRLPLTAGLIFDDRARASALRTPAAKHPITNTELHRRRPRFTPA